MKKWTGAVQCVLCGASRTITVKIEDEWAEPILPLKCWACGELSVRPVYPDEDEQ